MIDWDDDLNCTASGVVALGEVFWTPIDPTPSHDWAAVEYRTRPAVTTHRQGRQRLLGRGLAPPDAPHRLSVLARLLFGDARWLPGLADQRLAGGFEPFHTLIIPGGMLRLTMAWRYLAVRRLERG
jgi:hypothetical protein